MLLIDASDKLGHRVFIIIIAAIIAYVTRFILIRFMNRWMMSKSSKVKKSTISEKPISELSNNQKLSFEMLNLDADISNCIPYRKKMVERTKKMMRIQFFTDLLIGLVYIIVGYFVLDDGYPFYFSYFLFAILFLIWATMGYIGYRHQITAYKDGVFDVIAPLWNFIFAVFQFKWKNLLAIALFLMALIISVFDLSLSDFSKGIPMLLAVFFNIFLLYKLHKKAQKQTNLTVLILRVFLIKKTSLFTFSKLASYWKYFGSYFTVSDPSFYKVYWKRNFKRSFPVFIIITFLIYTQLENSAPGAFAPFIFLMVIGAIIFIIWSIRTMKRNFVKNESALQKELTRLKRKPVKLDGTFKETPISCYDNTWQMTVETLIKTASVVLMDLRGFSEKNKGCEFEVNLLLNKIALNQILFIGYEDTIPLIKETIEHKFETLETNSPNKDIKNPVATVFEIRNENNKETQYIMDILLNKALQ
jgi:predicted Holliday junction resolvase-like endonuclease